MKLLSKRVGSAWAEIGPSDYAPPPEPNPEEQKRLTGRNALKDLLNEILLSENLVILSGLGTSLCVVDSKERRLAPTMADLWKIAEEEAGDQFDLIKKDVGYIRPPSGDNIELLLSHCHLRRQLGGSQEIDKFVKRTEARIFASCRFVEPGNPLPVHEAFLRKVARRPTRLPRLQLFTTNYDLCFEGAASNTRFVVIDGFSHTLPQEFDPSYYDYDLVVRDKLNPAPDFIPNVFHLYKLHGSVDWAGSADGRILREKRPEEPLLIYPRHTKFESSYNPPFIEMMSRFQMALRQPNTGLIIVGFGFNDAHLVQPILSAVRSNVSLKALIVGPALYEDMRPVPTEIGGLIKRGDGRIHLLNATFEELVHVLPDLVATTEDEIHRERVRRVEVSS